MLMNLKQIPREISSSIHVSFSSKHVSFKMELQGMILNSMEVSIPNASNHPLKLEDNVL